MSDDPLLSHYEQLRARVDAWHDAWARRGEAANATVATVLGTNHVGAPLSAQIETRLLEARREIDNQIARFAGVVAAAVALCCRSGETDAIERSTQEGMLRLGKVEDGFATKMTELGPLVDLYVRIKRATTEASPSSGR